MLTIALPKGRLLHDCLRALRGTGLPLPEIEDEARQLVFQLEANGMRIVLARPSDVPTFVEHGAADVGIAGKDVLVEADAKVFELLDLGFGKGRFVLAAPDDSEIVRTKTWLPAGIRIATKYPNFTRKWLDGKNVRASVIYLRGAVELAPRIGLADAIVDLTSTGKTLAENDLKVVEEILPISARFICNVVSYRLKADQVDYLEARLGALASAEAGGVR